MANSVIKCNPTVYSATQSLSVDVSSDQLVIIFGGAGNAPEYTNAVYGFLIFATGSRYGILHQGSEITINRAISTIEVSSTIAQRMGFIRL